MEENNFLLNQNLEIFMLNQFVMQNHLINPNLYQTPDAFDFDNKFGLKTIYYSNILAKKNISENEKKEIEDYLKKFGV